jgi:hypothetical protein
MNGDLELAKDIQTAITSYITLSNDKKLTLGKESTASVDEILVKFQKDIIIDNDENYGYMLIPRKSPPDYIQSPGGR